MKVHRIYALVARHMYLYPPPACPRVHGNFLIGRFWIS